jgi:beta-1,4-N-acetylglucosaminyltransferase
MIFTTVGTTQFDELVEAMDKIAPELNEEVVIQLGDAKYIPRNCKHFTFENDLLKYFEKADIVIAHGGAGITFEVLNLGKKLVSVENPHVLEGHQIDLLGELSKEGYLIWCKDLNDIKNCIEDAKNMKMKHYVRPECEIGKTILAWLG